MQDHLELSLLLDYYGDFLTERQRSLMQLSVLDDLSLAEISEIEGISRQGVRDAIKRGGEQLRLMEARLGLMGRTAALTEGLKKLRADVEASGIADGGKAVIIKDIEALDALIEG